MGGCSGLAHNSSQNMLSSGNVTLNDMSTSAEQTFGYQANCGEYNGSSPYIATVYGSGVFNGAVQSYNAVKIYDVGTGNITGKFRLFGL